ncbi:MAG: histidinol dehydrogenase [Desulfovibrionaceae bacterium]|nr:histidinol dehydrogenase [Desulfovibrionaceae bacterium]
MPCKLFEFSSRDQWAQLAGMLKQRNTENPKIETAVKEILQQVQNRGDEALLEYSRKFDCPDFALSRLRVDRAEPAAAAAAISPADRALIEEAAANIRAFHAAQKERSWFNTEKNGSMTGQLVRPVSAAGLYIPGGQGGSTPLISTLMMTAIPALEAGVKRVVMVSPPGTDGSLNQYLLATAHILGISEVYAVGSAWAVAALAFGTESIAPVEVIAGPGNIYVTCAKRLVSGVVGIDMLAGPSEILIIADGSAPAGLIAADMLSQAEHDPMASAVCISSCDRLLKEIASELEARLADLPRAEIARASLKDWGALVRVADMQEAVELSNLIAPEHLELVVAEPWNLLGLVQNAGAVFMGANTPEAMGDYFAGPNHVLPTMGTARFSSSLSVHTFCKRINVIHSSAQYAAESAPKIARLARLEGLEAHARAAELRR